MAGRCDEVVDARSISDDEKFVSHQPKIFQALLALSLQ